MTEHVMAAVDGSSFSASVCDYAAWVSQALSTPLMFVHAVDNHPPTAESPDLSGSLRLGARETLMAELSELDEKRARINREQGRLMLEAACERAREQGVSDVRSCQRNGTLVETLADHEDATRLLVLGKRGERADQASGHLGSNLERAIREIRRPTLMVPSGDFRRPQKVMIAFDGSKTSRKGVEMLAQSPLFKGLECHVVTVGPDTAEHRMALAWAVDVLQQAGHAAEGAIKAGDTEATLHAYETDNAIDMTVMGAYGHSRIRQLLVGSTTTSMLRNAHVPVLILR
ncbi:universal stress protein [Vreelandella jeotgali]|uniref:universal stress protein n=1 Tax=Vreelandella jeotgali TaxID=553386 RepID=UPI0003484FC8|nr:universal stress protein [Halomonas jeotgali]